MVVQKRHHTRLFPLPQDQQNRDRSGNILPGVRGRGGVVGVGVVVTGPAQDGLLALMLPPPSLSSQARWLTPPSPTHLSLTSTSTPTPASRAPAGVLGGRGGEGEGEGGWCARSVPGQFVRPNSASLYTPPHPRRPTKYHVLVDENKFGADALQGLIYK